MRAAQRGVKHDVRTTLMPIKMNARYDVDELGENYLAASVLTLLKGLPGITYSGEGRNIKV